MAILGGKREWDLIVWRYEEAGRRWWQHGRGQALQTIVGPSRQ
jgi:hypothetical protein